MAPRLRSLRLAETKSPSPRCPLANHNRDSIPVLIMEAGARQC